MNDQPKVVLAELTECVSGRGTRYLKGYLGASNLVGFLAEPDEQGRPVWRLFLVERQPRPDTQHRPANGNRASSPELAGQRRNGSRIYVGRQSAAARQERAAEDVLERYGAADQLDDAIPF